MKKYIPIKRILLLYNKIKKEGKEVNKHCSICGKKKGDLYLFKKNDYFYLFKVKIRKHRMLGSLKYIDICDGCHIKYHLVGHLFQKIKTYTFKIFNNIFIFQLVFFYNINF